MVAEVLRSGAYSDEIVMNFVNRRFVATYYDVAPPGRNAGDAWAYDQGGVDLIGDIDRYGSRPRPLVGGGQSTDGRVRADSYPAALFVAPDGTHLGPGLWGILPPEKLLAGLKKIAADHPRWFGPTAEESAVLGKAAAAPGDGPAQLAAARLQWELAEFERCVEAAAAALASDSGAAVAAEAGWLRGRSLLALREPDKARVAFEAAARTAADAGRGLADAVQAGLALALVQESRHDEALALWETLAKSPEPGVWTGAAHYYAGLALHRLGRAKEAKTWWRTHRKSFPYDRLARRSAASLGLPEAEAFQNQEIHETLGWW